MLSRNSRLLWMILLALPVMVSVQAQSAIRWTMPEATFKRRLVTEAGIERNERILDLGCGTATLSILIKTIHPNARIVGIDGDSNS